MNFELFYKSFRPSGWFYHDMLLLILVIFLVFALIFFISKKAKPRTYLVFLCFYFFISSFIGIVFGGFGRKINYSTESKVYYIEEKDQLLSLVRAAIPNGTENGISTSLSHFELILIDADTGEKVWTKRLTWRHYLVGITNDYVIMNNPDKNWLYFLDIKTGKRVYSQKDLERKNKKLSDILSKSFTDYYVQQDNIYVHGNDGGYYSILADDLSITEITKEKFDTFTRFDFTQMLNEGEPYQDSDLINPITLSKADDFNYYVLSSQKRQNSKCYITFYDAAHNKINWQEKIDLSSEANLEVVIDTKDSIYLQSNGKLYCINKSAQKIDYVFHYRWNRID